MISWRAIPSCILLLSGEIRRFFGRRTLNPLELRESFRKDPSGIPAGGPATQATHRCVA
ncbi:hypothetical protein SBA4_1570007 [Candidatus Sulfopaludibacter sp. SbA4]|nr:hypothetical protein SBA4_1570007 [Candidatus Sulfopaludibacter sp. SbA4]